MLPRLVAITPGDGRALAPWIDALADAGLPGLILREPHLDGAALAALAERASAGIPWVALHDRNPAARGLPWPLHLPATADRSGLRQLFGVSCHDGAALDAAFHDGASWATLSPVWSPTSKPEDTRPTWGLDRFLRVARGRPVLALGGVDPARAQQAWARGATGVAVLGGIFGAASPEEAARRAVAVLEGLEELDVRYSSPTTKKRSS